jgi:hypothetical protein
MDIHETILRVSRHVAGWPAVGRTLFKPVLAQGRWSSHPGPHQMLTAESEQPDRGQRFPTPTPSLEDAFQKPHQPVADSACDVR